MTITTQLIRTTPATAATQGPAGVSLSGFLRDRRARLSPEPGEQHGRRRRRTPGLRREEVATRAGVSVTWYTWLEQGRGGPPSDDVLERLSAALQLDDTAREVLFLLAHQRPPPLRPAPLTPPVTPPAVQRVLDALSNSPAIVRTATWDVVAWNAAAVAVLTDYAAVPSAGRNVLRLMFLEPAVRQRLPDWEDDARALIAAFRIDTARVGDCPAATALVGELLEASPDFARLWAGQEMYTHGAGRIKRMIHPQAGPLTLEYSAFGVDGTDGLGVVVYTPATPADARAIDRLLARKRGGGPMQ